MLGAAVAVWFAVVLLVGLPALALGPAAYGPAGVVGCVVYLLALGAVGARRQARLAPDDPPMPEPERWLALWGDD